MNVVYQDRLPAFMPFCSFFPGKQLLAMQLYMVCCEPSSSLSHTPQCVRKCFRHEYRRSPLNIVIVGLYLAATMFTGWNISPLLGNQQRVTNTLTKAIGARKFTRGANNFNHLAPFQAPKGLKAHISVPSSIIGWWLNVVGACEPLYARLNLGTRLLATSSRAPSL